MRHAILAALAAAGTVAAPQVIAADPVTLSSPGGGVEITGRLLGYDGDTYRIDTAYGVLTVAAQGVDCAGVACPGPGPFVADLMISGAAGSGAALMPVLLEAFAEARGLKNVRQAEDAAHFLYVLSDAETGEDAARIRVRATSSAEGFADLLAETANVALSFRQASEAERTRALEAGLGDFSAASRSGVLALDALVAVVAPENPVREIALRDLARVLRGEVRSWAELGGPDEPITLHLPAEGSVLEAGIARRLSVTEGPITRDAKRHRSLGRLDEAVASNSLALGVTAFSGATTTRPLDILGSCGATIAPEPFAIKTEAYPLTTPHFVFTPDLPAPGILRDFLGFAQAPGAQKTIEEAGFVDQAITTRPLDVQGDRLARAILGTGRDVTAPDLRSMIRALEGAVQLSLTFRFTNGSADLDAPSRANVALLTDALRRGDLASGTLIFAGFSDSQGSGDTNRALSLRRAEVVRDALTGASQGSDVPVAIQAEGFGEAMPLACDEDAWGRELNRRVEVWFRPGQP